MGGKERGYEAAALEVEVPVPGGPPGKIRVYLVDGNPQFSAFCPCRDRDRAPCHGAACRKTLSGAGSKIRTKLAQGRPLGYLVCWLRASWEHSSCEAHRSARYSKQVREEGRAFLVNLKNGPLLMAWERNPRPGEGEEPDDDS